MNIDAHTNIYDQPKKRETDFEKERRMFFLEKELEIYRRTIKRIIGKKNNSYYVLSIDNIVAFGSKDKYNYCKTKDEEYRIKEQLYFLEEVLPKDNFLRISNSIIINIDFIKCFNTDIVGTIIVEMKDGSKEAVSKRRNKDIMNFIKNIK